MSIKKVVAAMMMGAALVTVSPVVDLPPCAMSVAHAQDVWAYSDNSGGANWQYYYSIDEGAEMMFIDMMLYLADVYMYNFDGEPCINGCTNWDIFWMYRSDGVVHFSLAVF